MGVSIKVSRLITGCVCLLFNWFLVWNFCKEFSRLDSLRIKSLFLVEQGSFLRYFLPYSLWYVSSSAFIFKRPFCSLGPSTSTTPLMCLESSEGSPSLLNEWNELQKEHHISKSYTPSHLNASSWLMNSVNFDLQFDVAIFIILISFLELKCRIPNCSFFPLFTKTSVSCSRKPNHMWSIMKIKNPNDLISKMFL